MIHWHGFFNTIFIFTWMVLMSTHSAGLAAAQQSDHGSAFKPGDHCQVSVTVADLRREPVEAVWQFEQPGRYPVDPLQETQVLLCEAVRVRQVRGQWVRVESLEQPKLTQQQQWEGYPGWLPVGVLSRRLPDDRPDAMVVAAYADLRDAPQPTGSVLLRAPLGARLQVGRQTEAWAAVRLPGGGSGWIKRSEIELVGDLPTRDSELRESIVRTAARFLGQPYLWGGRSWHIDRPGGQATGVDCSGLVHLAYRANGVTIPRDAHDQSLRARPLEPRRIRPADLIFLARLESPDRVYHVLMSTGGDEAIEAVHEQNVVRRVRLAERLGVPLRDLDASGKTSRLMVRVGRLLPE